jgi:hypothetical protein
MRNPFGKRQFYYLVTKVDGKIVVWLDESVKSEAEANQKGFSKLKGHLFQVIARPYRDVGKVTQEAKALNLESTGDLSESIRRASHQPDKLKFDERTDNAI